MTMLDRMRRHKSWLKWSLALVCVAFVLLYVPDFMSQPGTGAAARDVVAEVDGRDITVADFRRLYLGQLQMYRNMYGGNVSEDLLRQLGIDQQILQQLIDEQAALAEARRLGLTVSDAEVRERILTLPAFQENGRFIGRARYEQLLRLQRPPMRPAEFEEALRRSLLLDKLQAALTEWILVADAEVDSEYRRRHEKVKLEALVLEADTFREQVDVTDEELTAHFEADSAAYRIPEKRKIRYLPIDLQAIRDRTVISPPEIERSYNDNLDLYTTREQVRARHILLPIEGDEDEEAVRKEAEAILARARAGADFAELATKHSGDEGSAERGGDLDYFGRGQMVPEFEEAAFAAEPGDIVGPVRTAYGFHIIKVEDKRPAATRELDEVREQIEDQLKWERAQTEANQLVEAIAPQIRRPADLEKVAGARGLTVEESDFFQREEPIGPLGPAPEVSARAFEMNEGEVSGAIRTAQGYVFITVAARQQAYVPALDEVRERAREDVLTKKALEAAAARARELRAETGAEFASAVRRAGLELQSTEELITRGTPIPGVGVDPKVERVAFSLPAGAVSDPVLTDSAAVVLYVMEREDVPEDQVAEGREELRQELLAEHRNRFFSTYMAGAKQRMKIQVNYQVLQQAI